MKLRDSGMPDERYWESLFDVPTILDALEITSELADVAEMGCGFGTFTIRAAQRISGTLFAFDIDLPVQKVSPQLTTVFLTALVAG